MKRKLFCLLTLLLTVCSGAWATDYDLLFTVTSPTSNNLTQNGITVSSANSIQAKAFGGADPAINVYKINSSQLNIKSTSSNIRKIVFTACSSNTSNTSSLTIQTCATENGTYVNATSSNVTITGGESGTGTTISTNTIVCPKSISYTTATVEFSSDVQYVHIVRSGETWVNSIQVYSVAAPSREVVSINLDGVKKGSTTLTEGSEEDYTKAGTTITLTNKHKATTAPTDIKLIKKTTYTEGDPDYDDVAVELEKSGSVFTGTATIDKTTYTVNVPYDDTATLEADKSSVTVTSPKVATGSVTIHLTGANLTGANVSVAFASSVAGLSVDKASVAIADGAVDADVTVSYKSNADVAEANVNLVISTEGVSNIVIPVTYSSTAAVTELETISGTTDWNWSNTGQASNVASPDASSYVVFSNVDGWDAGFNAAAISGKASYLAYGNMTQANGLKIKTSVPGTITVKFSNTASGDARPYRWLAVNGTVLDYKSKDQTVVTAENISVPAGEVLIESIMGTTDADAKPEYVAANAMFNFRQLTFTEADVTAPTLSSSTPANGATDVATSGTIVLTFNEDIASVDAAKFTLTGATKGDVAIDGEDATKVNVAYSGASYSSTVTLSVAAEAVEDAAGNKSAELSDISFTTREQVIGGKAVFKFTAKSDWNNSNHQTVSPITATFTKNAEATYVKYSNGNTLVIAATGAYVITKIELGYVSEYLPGSNNITVSSGYGEINSAGTEWNGFAQSVTLTKGTGDARVNSLSVTYSEAVTITPANNMSTYVTPAALDFSEVDGLTAYVATGKGTGTVVMSPVTAVPADTPLLLVGTAGTPYSVPVAAEASAPGTNYLKKGPQDFTGTEEDKYILWTDGKFHLVDEGTLAANKAYLDLDGVGAHELSIVFDDEGETTALSEVRGLKSEVRGEYFNLNGQRVAQPTKGLYIVNGRKVVIK